MSEKFEKVREVFETLDIEDVEKIVRECQNRLNEIAIDRQRLREAYQEENRKLREEIYTLKDEIVRLKRWLDTWQKLASNVTTELNNVCRTEENNGPSPNTK